MHARAQLAGKELAALIGFDFHPAHGRSLGHRPAPQDAVLAELAALGLFAPGQRGFFDGRLWRQVNAKLARLAEAPGK
jgi:hypothetical protein